MEAPVVALDAEATLQVSTGLEQTCPLALQAEPTKRNRDMWSAFERLSGGLLGCLSQSGVAEHSLRL